MLPCKGYGQLQGSPARTWPTEHRPRRVTQARARLDEGGRAAAGVVTAGSAISRWSARLPSCVAGRARKVAVITIAAASSIQRGQPVRNMGFAFGQKETDPAICRVKLSHIGSLQHEIVGKFTYWENKTCPELFGDAWEFLQRCTFVWGFQCQVMSGSLALFCTS